MEGAELTNGGADSDPESGPMSSDNLVFADDLGWVNFMTRVMWPKLREAVRKKFEQEFIERVELKLRQKDVRWSKLDIDFDPGSRPPTLKGLRTYVKQCDELQGLQVDVDVEFISAKDFRMRPAIKGEYKKIPIDSYDVSVSYVKFEGTVSCVLAPFIDREPCFGAQQIFFFDPPSLRMEITNLRKLMGPMLGQIGGNLERIMAGMIIDVMAASFVLPQRVVLKMTHNLSLETLMTVKSPLPEGLLEVEVLEAENLLAADTAMLSQPTSDPFVQIRVGDACFRTSTVDKDLNPRWHDGNGVCCECGRLLVYNLNQAVWIEVYDDDLFKANDRIGYVGTSVYWLCKDAEGQTDGKWFDLCRPQEFGREDSPKSAGRLKLRARYLSLQGLEETTVTRKKLSPESAGEHLQKNPHIITVKVLGMEAESTSGLLDARAIVAWKPPKDPAPESKTRSSFGFSRSLLKAVSHGEREDGIRRKQQTTKGRDWGASLVGKTTMTPHVIQAITRLRNQGDQWGTKRIAKLLGIDEASVEAAASLRANFSFVWHQGFHFLQKAGHPPGAGSLRIDVQVPVAKGGHGGGAAKRDSSTPGGSLIANSTGLVGSVQLDLTEQVFDSSGKCSVRARLRREDAVPEAGGGADASRGGAEETPGGEGLRGDELCSKSIGHPVPGLLIEFSLEARALKEKNPEESLEKGQVPIPKEEFESKASIRTVEIKLT